MELRQDAINAFEAVVGEQSLLWIGSNSTTETPPLPFAELKVGGSQPMGVGTWERRRLEVWVHDEPGDYGFIDKCISRIRLAVPAMVSNKALEGDHLDFLAAEYVSTSVDLTDDGYRTICKYISIDIICRERLVS